MRAWIVLGVALLAGLVAVGLAARWMTQRSGDTSQLVVASRDVELGTPLDVTMVTTIAWSGAALPEGAYRDPEEVKGRVLKTAVSRGEPLLEGKFAPKGTKGGLSAVIGAGKRAISVRVNEVVGVAGFALPGSYVDVMVHMRVDDAKRGKDADVSRIVLEHILVLAVAQEASRDDTKPKVVNAVTLEVTPEEAEKLDLARSVGNLSLVLRNQMDKDAANTLGSSKADLFAVAAPAPASAAPPAPPQRAPRPVTRVAARAAPVVAPPKPAAPTVEVIRGVQRSEVEL
jgi:pilus assembly protein CpaB